MAETAAPTPQQRDDVIAAARAFYRLGYIHAFGHVSLRLGDGALITPTRPTFPVQTPADLLTVDSAGRVIAGDASARPIEVSLHLGIYRARPDVMAICRTHAPAASHWPAAGRAPPIEHGFGGLIGEVATWDETDLVHTLDMGARAAAALGGANGLIVRGNGALSVGASPGQAAARMWSLEERCAVAQKSAGRGAPFSVKEYEARRRWYGAEEERTWTWLRHIGTEDR